MVLRGTAREPLQSTHPARAAPPHLRCQARPRPLPPHVLTLDAPHTTTHPLRARNPVQVHAFYEAVGLMVGAEGDERKRNEYLMRLMAPPNSIWAALMQQVGRGALDVLTLVVATQVAGACSVRGGAPRGGARSTPARPHVMALLSPSQQLQTTPDTR